MPTNPDLAALSAAATQDNLSGGYLGCEFAFREALVNAYRTGNLVQIDREGMRERVARSMCIAGGFDPDEVMPNDGPRWGYYVPGADAAIAAILGGE